MKAQVYINDSVIFYASNIDSKTFEPIYEETFVCPIFNEKEEGAVRFFAYLSILEQLDSFEDVVENLNQGILSSLNIVIFIRTGRKIQRQLRELYFGRWKIRWSHWRR